MKQLILLLLCIVPFISNATDTLKLQLKSHKSDHYLAEYDDNVLVTVDTIGKQDHFEVQFLKKVNHPVNLKIYINGKIKYNVAARIKKHSMYAFYYKGDIRNARIEYSGVIYYIKVY